MWGEPCYRFCQRKFIDISTHSPRVGRTLIKWEYICWQSHFNSLAPCGANLVPIRSDSNFENFNSLAPCGANLQTLHSSGHRHLFQLTRPVWGEPRSYGSAAHVSKISTHSPRVGRTAASSPRCFMLFNFNSLAPCGANLVAYRRVTVKQLFQLTRPVWGEPMIGAGGGGSGGDFNSLAPCGANLYILYICRPFAATWGGQ